MNSSSTQQFCFCAKCGRKFDHMDMLVDHHSFDHRTFDQEVSPTLTAGEVQQFDG